MNSSQLQQLREAEFLFKAGHASQAESLLKRILLMAPGNPRANEIMGYILGNRGDSDGAVSHLNKAASAPDASPEACYYLGVALQGKGMHGQAIQAFQKALSIGGDFFQGLHDLGLAMASSLRYSEAIALFDKALALDPRSHEAHFNKARALDEMQRYAEALSCYGKAVSLKPDYTEAWVNRGLDLGALGKYQESLESFDTALRLNPRNVDAWLGRGVALREIERFEDALGCFDKVLAARPDDADAWFDSGDAFRGLKRYNQALASYDKGLQLQPDNAAAWANQGLTFLDLKRYQEAVDSYSKALAIDPDLPYRFAEWLHARMHVCEWRDLDESFSRIGEGVDDGKMVSSPFALLAIPASPLQQLRCAEIYTRDQHPASPQPLWRGQRYEHKRIRLGYFSSDFRNHPMAHLIAEMIERLDRSKFEVMAFSFSRQTADPIRLRLEKAFDRFIDVSAQSDHEIASLARQLEIDIAIDLNGYTANSRTAIFAMRPVPIQVNHMGYPGTMGADYIDYIVADTTVIPPEHCAFYSEKVVSLPDTYWFNDSTKVISDRSFSRAELGLPDDAVVFCCFNNNYKITPDLFDIWMRLLHRVDHSVLWLLEANPGAARNLREEAEKRGVSSDRLVFAPRLDMADHLARHRQADLFLDTFYYNAHTTASDALWAGLPILTCLGETFASRVAASLLNAIGLSELITHSHAEYEALAFELATQPDQLAALKEKLVGNRLTTPLFDTARFTRHLETAYTMMWQRFQAGSMADHIQL